MGIVEARPPRLTRILHERMSKHVVKRPPTFPTLCPKSVMLFLSLFCAFRERYVDSLAVLLTWVYFRSCMADTLCRDMPRGFAFASRAKNKQTMFTSARNGKKQRITSFFLRLWFFSRTNKNKRMKELKDNTLQEGYYSHLFFWSWRNSDKTKKRANGSKHP